jgi:hypothetical protein
MDLGESSKLIELACWKFTRDLRTTQKIMATTDMPCKIHSQPAKTLTQLHFANLNVLKLKI